MQAYSDYKDSGVEWLGEIPAGWEVKRFRNMFFFSKGLTITKENLQETGIPCVNYGEVHSKYGFEIDPKKHVLKCVKNNYLVSNPKSLLSIGDFVFADTSEDIEGSGNFTQLVSNEVVFAGYHTVVTKPIGDNNFRYLAYVLDSVSFRNQIRKAVKGVKVFSITKTILKNTSIWLPNHVEQIAIARFLDDKVGKIERLLAIKQQQIDLLKERQQILIQNAVTQGLNPNAPKKDSGIDWIGEIPVHWEVVKLKLLTNKIVDGAHFTPTYVRKGIPFLRVTDLTKMEEGKIQWGNVRYIPVKEHLELIKRANPEIGDILLSKNGTIGLTKVIDWERDFSFFVSLCLIKLKNLIDPIYFTAFFNSPIVDMQIAFGSSRTSVTNLHLEKIKELIIILPPLKEQKIIVCQIDNISKPINTAIQIKQQQIEKLKEYKTTLINAAVTGKIKVPPR